MKPIRIAAVANPVAATLGTVVLIAMLLMTMSLTALERQFVIFLCGVLAAAVLSGVSRTANDRWTIARRTAQLNATREKLAVQVRLGSSAAQGAARPGKGDLVDEALTAMLAYVDAKGVVRYHNKAYARWVARSGEAIDGRPAAELLGHPAHAAIEDRLREALDGHEVRYERTHTQDGGQVSRLFVHYIPHFEGDRVAGVFAILTDITLAASNPQAEAAAEPVGNVADRILGALERDEFCLFGQDIVPLAGGSGVLREVLLRLREEEDNHLPPGAFLPIAEAHGLLPAIDRWVVSHVVEGAARSGGAGRFFVNVSPATVAEGSLAPFVGGELARHRLGGQILCFEFAESDVMSSPRAYRDLMGELTSLGCRFAICGFGRNPSSVAFFRQLGASYLKIDAGIVLGLLREPAALARVKAIADAAHSAGMQVVAECVETAETRAALRDIGIDHAQGFGISLPGPLLFTPPESLALAA